MLLLARKKDRMDDNPWLNSSSWAALKVAKCGFGRLWGRPEEKNSNLASARKCCCDFVVGIVAHARINFCPNTTCYSILSNQRPRRLGRLSSCLLKSISWVQFSPSAHTRRDAFLHKNWVAESARAWVSNIRWKSTSSGNAEPYAR